MTTKTVEPHLFTHDGDRVLGLRRCNADGSSYGGFVWPLEGRVVAEDWEDTPKCGNGLHFWPWGLGLGEGADFDFTHDRWQVVSIDPSTPIRGGLDTGWKAKCRECEVHTYPSFMEAWAAVAAGHIALLTAMAQVAGYSSKQSAYYSTQAASGDSSKQAASGYSSTQAASGDYSMQAASGYYSTQAASGDYSKQAASGYSSKQAASGDSSTQAASGYSSKQSASGDSSKQATSGDSSTQAASGDYCKQAASGYYSTQAASGANAVCVQAGRHGKVCVGQHGAFCLCGQDAAGHPVLVVGRAGHDGIQAGVWYCLDADNRIIPVKETP